MDNKISANIAYGVIVIAALICAGLIWYENTDFQQEQGITPQNLEMDREGQPKHSDLIQVSFPVSGEKVGGDIYVTGIAKGNWYFEGEFPVELYDNQGQRLTRGSAMAQGEWMTDEFVPFSAHLQLRVDQQAKGRLALRRNNPSDLEEQNSHIEIPVTLVPEISSAQVYFPNRNRDANSSICETVVPASRPVSDGMASSRQVLEALLKGPSDAETDLGYYSAIPANVKIQSFDATSRNAKIDLSKELLDLAVDMACPRTLIAKQITETIKQASGAQAVMITVDGKDFPGELPDEGPASELIGGQKDEHGCLIGAGYSWCESKRKCLRTWEESCAGSANEKGVIEGSLSYPSEIIPEMEICAENIANQEKVCTTEQIQDKKFTYGIGYRLDVPAGKYFVYSALLDPEKLGATFRDDYRAYYSKFVTCGLNYGCPSHAPIEVTVSSGQAVSQIDPIDWYNN